MQNIFDKPQRVAAYCRVSTDKDDQANSLESQKKYFREFIEQNPYWELVQIYADEGVTGTSTKKRHAFNQMLSDAQNRAFDFVITKEISRFARNTLDSIHYTRKLKDLGIGVLFMNDNINTLDADAELRLTIMSSIAQEESRKTSERVKWGQKRRMEQGVVFGRDMLGYDVRGGKLYINEQGAEIVRLIFHKFVNEEKGTHVIARELREAGIQTAAYMKQWSNTVILRVLRNEKYVGELIQKKTFTPNYLTHEKKSNRGEEEYVTLHKHHKSIIDRELFELAQRELARRSLSEENKAKHSNRYCFSGKIKCGICDSSFVSRSKKRSGESIYKAWRCYEGAKNGSSHIDKAGNQVGCSCPSLNDEDAKWMLREVVKNLKIDKQKHVDNITGIIYRILNATPVESKSKTLQLKLAQVGEKKQRLLEMYLEKTISKVDFQNMNMMINAEINSIQKQLTDCQCQHELNANHSELLSNISSALRKLSFGEEWNDTFYRHILGKIIVFNNGHVDIRLALMPTEWRFSRNSGDNRHLDASVPISVSSPFNSG